ncbi:MAG: lysophospholipid acyltransferase family protein [Gemmatimonadaceae bacterium]
MSRTIVVAIPASVPRVRRPMLRRFARLALRLLGWRIVGELPDQAKFVIAVAPHTSNWDFVLAFLSYLALELRASWLGKHTIFRFPFGPILRYFGGIPVVRGAAADVVDRAVAEFNAHTAFVLALAPEGTRRRVQSWRSGFHRIALGAGVPVVATSLDFAKRQVELGPTFHPTGDFAADLRPLLERFSRVTPKHPARYNPAPVV